MWDHDNFAGLNSYIVHWQSKNSNHSVAEKILMDWVYAFWAQLEMAWPVLKQIEDTGQDICRVWGHIVLNIPVSKAIIDMNLVSFDLEVIVWKVILR